MFTAVPNRSPSSAIGSPALSPTRIRIGSGAASLCAAKVCCMATAHSRALVAEEKDAMNPSPIVFTSEPPYDFNVTDVALVLAQKWRALASPARSVTP